MSAFYHLVSYLDVKNRKKTPIKWIMKWKRMKTVWKINQIEWTVDMFEMLLGFAVELIESTGLCVKHFKAIQFHTNEKWFVYGFSLNFKTDRFGWQNKVNHMCKNNYALKIFFLNLDIEKSLFIFSLFHNCILIS